ncbi:hypothetical protein B0H34DRAFT_541428 [Crassisporium funariophilum]|nr:hypothetical protein B0H34DRAFT_541428 [Crassisporium funariophilum]
MSDSIQIMIWDTLHNLRNDYLLLTQHRIRAPTVVYFVSRVATLAYAAAKTVFLTVQTEDCQAFEMVLIGLYIIFATSTTFLSYLRVCAIWDHNKYIVGFFGLSWLSVVGGSLSLVKGIRGTHFPEGTNFCIDVLIGRYVPVTLFTGLTNDTFLFLATTYGISRSRILLDPTLKGGIRTVIFGSSLPEFSRALLLDSQLCYMIAMCASIVNALWLFLSVKDPASPFRLALVITYIVSVNIMFCRVFRNTKLGLYRKAAVSLPMSSMTSDAEMMRVRGRHFSSVVDDGDFDMNAYTGHVEVSVKKIVEYQHDYPTIRSKTQSGFQDDVLNIRIG